MDGSINVGGLLAALVLIPLCFFLIRILINAKKLVSAAAKPTVRIHLEQTAPAKNAEFVQKQQEMIALGLNDLGCFKVVEMPGLTLAAYLDASKGIIGIVYTMPVVGIWLDLVRYNQDGSSITASSATQGAQLKQRPDHKKLRLAKASAGELYELLLQNMDGKEPKVIEESTSVFKKMFEKAYADEMDWRNSLGGPSLEEIRAIAGASGKQYPDEVFAAALLKEQKKACEGLVVAFSEIYREKHHLSENDWSKIAPKIIFVHDKIPQPLIKEILTKMQLDLPASAGQLGSLQSPPRQLFRELLSSSAGSKKLRKIDELTQPLSTEVYELISTT